MKKVLIYFPVGRLNPRGGPAGYLYNLNNELDRFSHNIHFLQDVKMGTADQVVLRRQIPNRIKDFWRAVRFIFLLRKKVEVDSLINKYDLIHFHSTEDMYYCRDFLATYKGIVVLTSHSPCIYHQELIDRLNPFDARIFKKQLIKLEKIDEYAFQRTNYVIFPCREAEEPYYHTWKKYGALRNNNKYRYLPTGILQCAAKEKREVVRKKYYIPEDAFVISYVGRHNSIKGYEDLKIIGTKVLEAYPDMWFLIAGKEEPMKGLQNDHWIEVGWTNDPHSLISASDLFILPNIETYFDLIMLEVLSLGKFILASDTGGNRYFKKFDNVGILLYHNLEEAVQYILKIYGMNQVEKKDMEKANEELFKNNFTSRTFAQNYIELLETLS